MLLSQKLVIDRTNTWMRHTTFHKRLSYSSMIEDRSTALLLSPPNSPRMSDEGQKPDYSWQQASAASGHLGPSGQPQLLPIGGPGSLAAVPRHLDPQFRPPLRSHNSYQYLLGPQGHPQYAQSYRSTSAPSPNMISAGTQSGVDPRVPQTIPGGRLTPTSSGVGPNENQSEEEGKLDVSEPEQEEDEPDTSQMTAAELRQHKRKMKRFRLTHNQTRFLMNEFSKQAHPDAAHRERLSREIPGLSPRQVQVWFQNRRAKLKRLTSDDRERVMRSRALPSDFDPNHGLHTSYAPQHPSINARMPSPAYGQYGEPSGARSLTIDTFRRGPEYDAYGPTFTSPSGISPAIGAFTFTPPRSATDVISPTSGGSSGSTFSHAPHESPRRYGGMMIPTQQSYVPHGMHVPDRLSRSLGESAGSPLRASISYGALGAHSQGPHHGPLQRTSPFPEGGHTEQDRAHPQRSVTGPVGSGPYGLGVSYPPQPGAPQPQQYRRASSHLAGPPIASYPSYQSSPYAPNFPSVYSHPSFQHPSYAHPDTERQHPHPQPQQQPAQQQEGDQQQQQQQHQEQQQQHQQFSGPYGYVPTTQDQPQDTNVSAPPPQPY